VCTAECGVVAIRGQKRITGPDTQPDGKDTHCMVGHDPMQSQNRPSQPVCIATSALSCEASGLMVIAGRTSLR
jgi:hypothetical protein